MVEQRRRRTGVHRYIFTPCPFASQSGITRGFVQTHVAGHGGQRADIQLIRRGQREQQGDHVVSAGIGVDDQVDFLRRLGAGGSDDGQKQQTPEQLVQFLSIALHGAFLVQIKSENQNATPATSTMLQYGWHSPVRTIARACRLSTLNCS